MKTSRRQLIRRRLLAALASASCLAFPFAAQADASYPDKPVRIVVRATMD